MNYLVPINMHYSFMTFTKRGNHTSPVKQYVISSLFAFSALYFVFSDDLH